MAFSRFVLLRPAFSRGAWTNPYLNTSYQEAFKEYYCHISKMNAILIQNVILVQLYKCSSVLSVTFPDWCVLFLFSSDIRITEYLKGFTSRFLSFTYWTCWDNLLIWDIHICILHSFYHSYYISCWAHQNMIYICLQFLFTKEL